MKDKISESVKIIEESENITIPTTEGFYWSKKDKWLIFCPFCNKWHSHCEALKSNKTKTVDVIRYSHCFIGSYRIKGNSEITAGMIYDTQRKNPYGPNNLPKPKLAIKQEEFKNLVEESDRRFVEMHNKLFPNLIEK